MSTRSASAISTTTRSNCGAGLWLQLLLELLLLVLRLQLKAWYQPCCELRCGSSTLVDTKPDANFQNASRLALDSSTSKNEAGKGCLMALVRPLTFVRQPGHLGQDVFGRTTSTPGSYLGGPPRHTQPCDLISGNWRAHLRPSPIRSREMAAQASATLLSKCSAAPWKAQLQKSLQKNRSLANARYVQLATIKPDGKPANRTIVFRCAPSMSARLAQGFTMWVLTCAILSACGVCSLCRGFLGESNDLTFVTDSRSSKVSHMPPHHPLKETLHSSHRVCKVAMLSSSPATSCLPARWRKWQRAQRQRFAGTSPTLGSSTALAAT